MSRPESLTKDELKRDLRHRGITFSSNASKDELVKLHRQKLSKSLRSKIEFSDEDLSHSPNRRRKATAQKKISIETYLPSVKLLSDEELVEDLKEHGVIPGPITESTRSVYQKKLASLKTKGVISVSHARMHEKEDVDYQDLSDREDMSSDDVVGEDSNDEETQDVHVPLVAEYSQHKERSPKLVRKPESARIISGHRDDILQRRHGLHDRESRKSIPKPSRPAAPKTSGVGVTTWCSCLAQTVAIIMVLMLTVLLVIFLVTGELPTKPLLDWFPK